MEGYIEMNKKHIPLVRLYAITAAFVMGLVFAAQPAHGQITFGVRIGAPPPPLRYEARPPAPGPGFVWVDGYYEPYNNNYRWHPGYWNRAPYEGAYYIHPHWDHYPDGWHMHEGYWAHEDHDPHYWDNHHPR